jgi:PAS domain S-box-containing protein
MDCEMESTGPNNPVESNLAREALKECEQKFNILLEMLSEGVIIHDRFKIIDSNRGFAAIFGYDHPETIGRDVLEFADQQSRDLIMNKLLEGNETPFKVHALKKDGSTFDAELCSRIIPHRDHELNLTVFRKLSDSGSAEPKDDRANERLGEFFDYSPDAYYLADATGKFIDVNRAAEKLFAHRKDEIIGKSFLKLNLLSSDQIHKAAKHLALNIFGQPTEPEEYVIQRDNGVQLPVEIRTLPVYLNGKTLLFGIVRDITEKKKSADALRRAIKEIELLVEERGSQQRKKAHTRKNGKKP